MFGDAQTRLPRLVSEINVGRPKKFTKIYNPKTSPIPQRVSTVLHCTFDMENITV